MVIEKSSYERSFFCTPLKKYSKSYEATPVATLSLVASKSLEYVYFVLTLLLQQSEHPSENTFLLLLS